MSIKEKINKLNIKLPDPKEPIGAYAACKFVGNLEISSEMLLAAMYAPRKNLESLQHGFSCEVRTS